MKKLFLLIPALVLSLITNAAVININTETADALRVALYNANDGDEIVMAPGTYVESNENFIAFTGKNITVRAEEGAEVIIQPKVPITVANGGCAHLQNVKIDASRLLELADWYEHVIYATDAAANNRIILEGCEIYGFALNKSLISCPSASALDELTINNCYFHNINKSCVFIENTSNAIAINITNSTFANITTVEGSYYAGVIDTRATSGSFLVDHCTFYNVEAMNTDYAAIGKMKLASGAIVSNCIFALSAPGASSNRTIRDVVAANNCLVYNYSTDGGYGMQSNVTKTGCFIADPLFADAANGDFSLAGDWTTMSLSPARGAATDGSDLGDPRWYTAETLPSTDFASPYAFIGAKAIVSDKMELDENNYIHSKGSSGGSAIWKVTATRACAVQVQLNMSDATTSGHNYKVEVFDYTGNSIGFLDEGGWQNYVDDRVLAGIISFPAEGDYKIILTNSISGTESTIKGITFTYVGGANVNIPAEELLGTEAVLVNNGNLKVSKLENGDLKYNDNGNPLGEYVYWNVNATKAGSMDITLNVVADPEKENQSTHHFLVELYSDLSEEPIATSEESATSQTGARALPALNIPAAGNYIVKLTNQQQWSSAILHSIEFAYAGGIVMNIPSDELIGEDAVIVDLGNKKVKKLENGNLKYGDNSNPLGEYVYWNINATKYGRMDVTLNVVADPEKENQSTHHFLVELYSDLNEEPIAISEESATSQTGARALPALNIPAAGNYIVKLTNQQQWSSAILHSIEFAYAGGEISNVPGQILGADAMLLKEDGGTLKMYHDANGDIQYNNNGYNLTEYAQWNIQAENAIEMIVTLNIAHSGHLFTVELYNGETLIGSALEADATKWDEGDIILEDHLSIPAAGNYTIKLINRQQYSGGALHSITFSEYIAPEQIVLNEMDANNSAWASKVNDGNSYDIQIIRTIVPDMYNTICLPFDVSSSQLQAIFGSDVKLLQMASATLNGNDLNLEFEETTSIYHGTPFLIKTSNTVTNPVFADVEIKAEEGAATGGEGFAADFIGSFIAGEVPAGDQNLFLGPNDQLYFSQTATPIKGMRAYFHVKVPGAANIVSRARIVLKTNTTTDIDNISTKAGESVKTIENGQIVIIRDGVRYNVMGSKIQ